MFEINKLPTTIEMDRNISLEVFSNLEFLAYGSNSHIYGAIWNNKQVVVKMLQNEKMTNPVALHEFEIECELLSRIDHPNVIRVLGAGMTPRPFIVLERLRDMSTVLDLDGSDVRPSMFRRRAFNYLEILKLAKSLADALDYLHSKVHSEAMIVHRDLKPENLGINSDGTVKLFDFGLCRCVKKRTSSSEAYTMTGNTGSIRYMAPEVVLNKPYTEKVDVYSFGILIWAVARNKHPYRGFTMGEHYTRVVIGGERPKLEDGWPKDFRDLLSACWHHNSRSRPNFSVVAAELSRMIEAKRPTLQINPADNPAYRQVSTIHRSGIPIPPEPKGAEGGVSRGEGGSRAGTHYR